MGASCKRLGGFLGRRWTIMEASEGIFRFSAALKPSWDRLGGVLEALGSALGAWWRRLGREAPEGLYSQVL